MQLPTIHLNGDSRETLIEGYCNASNAIEEAYQALKQTSPNGRNFYPQGPEAMAKAEEEHMGRLRRLDAIKIELTDLIVAIDRIP